MQTALIRRTIHSPLSTKIASVGRKTAVGTTLCGIGSSIGRYFSTPATSKEKQVESDEPPGFVFPTPLPPQDEHDETRFIPNTLTCDHPVDVVVPSPPHTPFHWTKSVRKLCSHFYNDGYDIQPKTWNPYLFFTENGHEQGKEQVETFMKNLPSHPTDPALLPNLSYIPDKFKDHPAFPKEKDSATLMAVCHFGPLSSGPPGIAHGGLNATVADVLMYRLLEKSGRVGVTAALNVQYKTPVPLGKPVVAVGSIELTGPRKAAGTFAIFSEDFETLHLESSGVFVTPREWVGVQKLNYGSSAAENTPPPTPSHKH